MKKMRRTRRIRRALYMAIGGVLSIWGGGFTPVFAAANASLDLGQIVVQPETPVGAILVEKSQNVILNRDDLPFCSQLSAVFNVLASLKYRDVVDRASVSGQSNVFASGISGVGLQVEQIAPDNDTLNVGVYDNGSFNSSGNVLKLVCQNNPQNVTIRVRAIKTGENVGSGAIQGGNLATFSSFIKVLSILNLGEQPILRTDVSGTVVSSTCEVQGPSNIEVDLAHVARTRFTGVGSVAAEQPFAIELQCSGMDDARDAVALSLSYQPFSGLQDRGVLGNQANSDAASGIGIQVLDANHDPVPPDTNVDARALPNGQTGQRFQFSARYYQVRDTISAGRINATAQYTITYP